MQFRRYSPFEILASRPGNDSTSRARKKQPKDQNQNTPRNCKVFAANRSLRFDLIRRYFVPSLEYRDLLMRRVVAHLRIDIVRPLIYALKLDEDVWLRTRNQKVSKVFAKNLSLEKDVNCFNITM